MLKYLNDNTWGYVQNDDIIVQAKYWFYPELPTGHSLYKVGLIGDFQCSEEATLEQSFLVFNQLETELKKLGVIKVIGPINGSTWQNYRLTTYYGNEKPFLLEPYTPQYFIKHWNHFGFKPEHNYSSYKMDITQWSDERIHKLHSKFSELTFKSLCEKDLNAIFDLSVKSFVKNPYYIDIDKETYLTKYGKMMALLQPNISLVIYDKNELVGYLFAILNPSSNPQERPDSVILKTIAISDNRKYAGLGTYLLSKLVEEMTKINVKYIIHALMYDNNPVQNIIKDCSVKMRGYTLFQKEI